MDAARVLHLLAHLKTRDIEVWLDGGWAIDALLEEQTRPHDDLDLVARLDDSAQIERALDERGYVLAAGGPPASFELVDGDGHQVDVHPVSFTTTGHSVYRMANGEDWIYPADAFSGLGRILGDDVPCLTPEVVMISHTTGYTLDEAQRQDVTALGERYGIPLPDFPNA
jgi:lincosamide nucleotidyltransferase A/C/D/E